MKKNKKKKNPVVEQLKKEIREAEIINRAREVRKEKNEKIIKKT